MKLSSLNSCGVKFKAMQDSIYIRILKKVILTIVPWGNFKKIKKYG
jgi:hypothetical protein